MNAPNLTDLTGAAPTLSTPTPTDQATQTPKASPFQQVVRARTRGLLAVCIALLLGLIVSGLCWYFEDWLALWPSWLGFGPSLEIYTAISALSLTFAALLTPKALPQVPLKALERVGLHVFMGGKRMQWTWGVLSVVLLTLTVLMPFHLGSPLLLGLAAAASTISIVSRHKLDALIESELLAPPETLQNQPPSPRLSGSTYTQELIAHLRAHPELGSSTHHSTLPSYGRNIDPQGLQRLGQRWPLLKQAWLERIRITELSSGQSEALKLLTQTKPGVRGAIDFAFVGTSGSGRGTLVNLMTLGSLLYQEGIVHCISAEGPRPQLSSDALASPRNAMEQFLSWLSHDATLRAQVSTAFSAHDERLDLSQEKAVYFTDARAFVDELLKLASHSQALPAVLAKLRYVIIDQPEQLTREELMRLRLSMSRLRLLLETHDREVSFILLLPPVDNHAEFAKYLTSNDHVQICKFTAASDPCELLTWQLPSELQPTQTQSSTPYEIQTLLSALIAHADQLVRAKSSEGPQAPLRMAIVDPLHRLGPEGQRELTQRCLALAGKGIDSSETYRIHVELHFLQDMQLAHDPEHHYEVLVSLGLGPFPSWLVNSLRPSLARGALLLLVSDQSLEDHASLAQMGEHWQPHPPFVGQHSPFGLPAMPSLVLAEAPRALVAHELCLLLGSVPPSTLTVPRVLELFPGPFTAELLDMLVQGGAIALKEAFYRKPNSQVVEVQPLIELLDLKWVERLCPPLPWGCLSNDTLVIHDASARSTAGIWLRRDITEHVDADRLFIDLFPAARLPYAPHTRVVSQVRTLERPIQGGFLRELRLEQPGFEDALSLSQRRLRTTVSGHDLAPLSEQDSHSAHLHRELPPLAHALELDSPNERTLHLLSAACRTFERTPLARLSIGAWVMTLNERFRDTLASPSEQPWAAHLPISLEHSPLMREALHRSYASTTLSLFIEVDPQAGSISRAGVQALANLLKAYLRRFYLHLSTEHDVVVLPLPKAQGHLLPWRLVLRRLRQGEVGPLSSLEKVLRERLLNSQFLRWAQSTLEACTCDNGCRLCCGGLGYQAVSAQKVPLSLFQEEDWVSSQEAAHLIGLLLGEAPSTSPRH